jgi:hypothetical protein
VDGATRRVAERADPANVCQLVVESDDVRGGVEVQELGMLGLRPAKLPVLGRVLLMMIERPNKTQAVAVRLG